MGCISKGRLEALVIVVLIIITIRSVAEYEGNMLLSQIIEYLVERMSVCLSVCHAVVNFRISTFRNSGIIIVFKFDVRTLL